MMRAGFSNLDPVAAYVAQTCMLADKFKVPPSAIHQMQPLSQARFTRKDRTLMLAYYQVFVETEEEERNRRR